MNMKWYVLHVLTGSELEAQRQLRDKGIDAVVLQECVQLRRGGQWHEETRTLFPGYVFLFMKYTVEMHHIIKSVAGAIRLLPKDKAEPLSPRDCAWLILYAGDDVLPPSRVDFSGDEPVVVDGPLKDFEDYVVKYHRRQRRVSLRIPLLGGHNDITLSIMPV